MRPTADHNCDLKLLNPVLLMSPFCDKHALLVYMTSGKLEARKRLKNNQ